MARCHPGDFPQEQANDHRLERAARHRLIECVGPDEYNRLHAEEMARSTVATVNGHAIHKVQSRFGKLYQVGRTGTAFSEFEAAKNFASKKRASR